MEVKITEHMLVSLFCFIIISCGGSQGSLGCDVEVQVRRGQVYAVSPHEYVEIKCPVQHCGKPVHVVWCKFLDINFCKQLNNSDHIQIKEGMLSNDRMESVLIFKKIFAEDSGEYSCREMKYQIVGHMINVNVSEMNQGGQNHDKKSDHPQNCENDQSVSNEDEMKMTALVYFIIFLSIVLVLFAITAIVLLKMYGCKSMPRHQPQTKEEQPSHMLPGLPRRSSPILHQSSCIVKIEAPSNHPERAIGGQLLTGPSEAPSPESVVYSKIDRTKSRKSFQHHASVQSSGQMNVISVVSSEIL
ncbi:hypothetical protein NL108_007751 [Boleophthalmus pectinirostris]|uniref:B- and T-lymphocyte attenuator-like n=1 Tax=Boleophthalmus pectinirostris TaxID=150288 RepID=UPI00242C1F1F|nr:B- and T-lymphocyte attenuator-like [Boleophthalmus pectinirostris]KAJ0070387.1 hypothetical protein NL108_007751 [Boleophthalmus pectinirostris]